MNAPEEITIDITPTWGEVGLMLLRLAASGETQAIQAMRPEIAKAFAAAEALKQIWRTLSPAQKAIVDRVLPSEFLKSSR